MTCRFSVKAILGSLEVVNLRVWPSFTTGWVGVLGPKERVERLAWRGWADLEAEACKVRLRWCSWTSLMELVGEMGWVGGK